MGQNSRHLKGANPPILSVSIDIDGVLAFFTEAMIAMINAKFDKQYAPDDATIFEWDWLDSKPEVDYATSLFARPEFYLSMAPDYAAIAALMAIQAAGIRINLASDRPPEMAEVTARWLAACRIPHDELLVGRGNKERLARLHGPTNPIVFVDDNPSKAKSIPAPGVVLFILQRTYTGNDIEGAAIVVDTWGEVLDYLGVDRSLAKVPQLDTKGAY